MLRSLIITITILSLFGCATHGPLHQAAGSGQADAIASLIAEGRDVNELDSDGWTPLMHAVYYGYAPTVRELLRLGADPNIQDEQKWTALHYAADTGRADIAQFLVENDADIYLEDIYGKTAFMVAQEYVARGRHPGLLQRLLNLGGGSEGVVVNPMPPRKEPTQESKQEGY